MTVYFGQNKHKNNCQKVGLDLHVYLFVLCLDSFISEQYS